jgi:hypothetical protein
MRHDNTIKFILKENKIEYNIMPVGKKAIIIIGSTLTAVAGAGVVHQYCVNKYKRGDATLENKCPYVCDSKKETNVKTK